jgi:hypothetical protein
VLTVGITDTQSYSWVIRNVFFDALARDPFFADFFKRKTKMLPTQPEHLPFLGVYIIDETMTPDGDANAGCVRFSHTLRVGFSSFIAHNDDEQAEQLLDAIFWRIMNALWPDPYIMNVIDSTNPDNTLIESIVRGTRRNVFGAANLSNETPLAELQYDVSCFYRTMWEPDIRDSLDEVHLRTGIKIGETEEEMARRPQTGVAMVFEAQPEQGSR